MRDAPTLDPRAIPALCRPADIRRHYLPVSGRTLDRLISSGGWPPPDVRIGARLRLWRRETIEAAIKKITERTPK